MTEQAAEYLMMGLRLSEGIDPVRYAKLAGQPLDGDKLERLGDLGMISVDGHRLRATEAGRMVLNAVIRELHPE